MDHILTLCMAPMHGPPYVFIGVMLKIQMEFSVEVKHPVGVVHPIRCWSKMQVWAV